MAKPKLWLGLAVSGVALLTLVLAAQQLADANEGLINDALGLSTQKIDKIDSDEVEGSAYAEEDDEEPTLGYKLFVYDPASGKAEELLHGVNEYDFSYIFTDEDRVVLGGSRPLYYYPETGETRLDDGEGRLDAGVGCGMHWITRSEWEIVSDSGETLYAGSFPLPRMPEALYGRSYIGCDGGAFYYSFISFSSDKPLSFILRFDTATGEAGIVWQSEG